MAAVAQISASLSVSIRDACAFSPAPIPSRPSLSNFAQTRSFFATGSPLGTLRRTSCQKKYAASKATPFSIKCEQSTQESGLDVWLGRFAMIGFAVAISVEIATGKGLLENFGLSSPLPTVALAVTALVGVLTAVFIFQSSKKLIILDSFALFV
uniref:Stress enhanced protein 1, chloroplastic n=1 Tax=Cannabis sativa TaxID=3483 RepID=A0A803NNL9_CANSA